MRDPLKFSIEPELRNPVLVLSYAGWNDGGECSSSAATYLLETLAAARLASLDLEEYLDFTVVRPHVRRRGDEREIIWPAHEFYSVECPTQDFDLVIGLGVEPHMRWKSYAQQVVNFVERVGIQRVVLMGAFLDEVIYSQPIDVMGFASDPEVAREWDLASSEYEGPTGMIGVLGETIAATGIPTASLWARLPHYVNETPNWRGSLALLQKLERVLDMPMDLTGLEERAGEFDQEVSETIAGDPQLAAYVRELKRRAFSQ